MRIRDWSSAVCASDLVDLAEHLLDRAGALRAPEARDGAEAAGLVAALGHLHVGPRGRARRAGQVEQVEGGERRLAGPAAERDRPAEAGGGLGLRQRLSRLVAVAPGQSPGHAKIASAPG